MDGMDGDQAAKIPRAIRAAAIVRRGDLNSPSSRQLVGCVSIGAAPAAADDRFCGGRKIGTLHSGPEGGPFDTRLT